MPTESRNWLKQGALNITEHGFSRGLDAAATLALIWFVPISVFAQLALSQAYVAPALFFFISPETELYKEFGNWERQGKDVLIARVRAFRRFALIKAVIAIILALLIAAVFPGPVEFTFADRFSALIWAFSLPLLPQVSGPDREFLRLSLDLKRLNLITILQRAIYLSLLVVAATFFSISFRSLAVIGMITALVTVWYSRREVERVFVGVRAARIPEENPWILFQGSLRGFSFWNHVSGVVTGWMQTLDLFIIGWFRLPAAEVGLYSIALKLSGFTLAIPYAVSNLFNVLLGRTDDASITGRVRFEKLLLVKSTLLLAAFCSLQALLFYWLSPFVLESFSRGRWDLPEQARIVGWLRWILPACALFGSLLFWTGWLSIRRSFQKLVLFVYLPWGLGGAVIYFLSVQGGGVDAVARANLSVMVLLALLLSIFTVFADMKETRGKTV